MAVEAKNRILGIQFRVATGERRAEQDRFLGIARRSGVQKEQTHFAAPLLDRDDGSGLLVGRQLTPKVLEKFGTFVVFGSDDSRISAARDVSLPLQDRVDNVLIPVIRKLVENGKSSLYICYGHQMFVRALDGEVGCVRHQPSVQEVFLQQMVEGLPVHRDLPNPVRAVAIHMDAAKKPPPGAEVTGMTMVDPNDETTVWDSIAALSLNNSFTYQPHIEQRESTQLIVINFLSDALAQSNA